MIQLNEYTITINGQVLSDILYNRNPEDFEVLETSEDIDLKRGMAYCDVVFRHNESGRIFRAFYNYYGESEADIKLNDFYVCGEVIPVQIMTVIYRDKVVV